MSVHTNPVQLFKDDDYTAKLRARLVTALRHGGLSAVDAEARAQSALKRFTENHDHLDRYFGEKSLELCRAARRFGVDSFTAADLAQTAVSGFIHWLIDHPLQVENPESFTPFLYKRLVWIRNTHFKQSVREVAASQFVRGEGMAKAAFDLDTIPRPHNESATLLRIMVGSRFCEFYDELSRAYRPGFIHALRQFCATANPEDLVIQFYHARLLVFTRIEDEVRSTEDVEALGHLLHLKLNAVQAALCRAQKPWTETEGSVFRCSVLSEGREAGVNTTEAITVGGHRPPLQRETIHKPEGQ